MTSRDFLIKAEADLKPYVLRSSHFHNAHRTAGFYRWANPDICVMAVQSVKQSIAHAVLSTFLELGLHTLCSELLECKIDLPKPTDYRPSWYKHEWDPESPACVCCGAWMSLAFGCEWSEDESLNLCGSCAVELLGLIINGQPIEQSDA